MKTTPIKRAPRAARRIGLWPYDLYPYVTSYVVLSQGIHQGGPEYRLQGGCVHWTKPLAIMSEAKGREIIAKLDALKAEYANERAILDDQFTSKARAFLPFAVPALAAT